MPRTGLGDQENGYSPSSRRYTSTLYEYYQRREKRCNRNDQTGMCDKGLVYRVEGDCGANLRKTKR